MRALMIGAHPDDNEFRYGGIAKKYVMQGHEVRFLSLLDGSGGHHEMNRNETAARRYLETRKVEQYLGITYDVWNIPDCELVADLQIRARLIHAIRNYNPDLIFCNRPNDYHADHRNASILVQDASYLLIVPNYCPETKAMRQMPVILYCEDAFKNPPFVPDMVIDIDDVIEDKCRIADMHESQVYEWLPFTNGELEDVPKDPGQRYKWLKGMKIDENTSDEEVLAGGRGYLRRFALPAARYRDKLVERYGAVRGNKARFAEAFAICEYGARVTAEKLNQLFPF